MGIFESLPNTVKDSQELAELIEELMPAASVSTTYDLESFQLAVTDMLSVARNGVIGIK